MCTNTHAALQYTCTCLVYYIMHIRTYYFHWCNTCVTHVYVPTYMHNTHHMHTMYAFIMKLMIPFFCRTVLTVFIFCSRAMLSGVYQTLYIYTPEVYPTSVRALGLCICTATAYLGGAISPYILQVMPFY